MSRVRLPLEACLALGCLVALWLTSSWLGDLGRSSGLLFIFILSAAQFGDLLFPQFSQKRRWLLGTLLLLSWQTLLQTAAYYASIPLNKQTDLIVSLILILVLFAVYGWRQVYPHSITNQKEEPLEERPHLWLSTICVAAAMSALFLCLFIAAKHGTTTSIRTPWPLVPRGFFLLLSVPFLASYWSAWRSRSIGATTLCVMATLLSVSCLTPLLYPNGYGFDGFLHRASEHLLLDTGTLHPKPPYYLGQYTFITWLARLCTLSVRPFDIWLVPLAILLPLLVFWILARNTAEQRWQLALLPLLLPLSSLVTTTPQAFSYLLGFTGLIIAWKGKDLRLSPLLGFSLGLWAVASHPLGGLPFFGAILMLFWWHEPRLAAWLRNIGAASIWLGSIFLIPLLFVLQKDAVHWQWSIFSNLSALKTTLWSFLQTPGPHLNPWIDVADTVRFVLPLLLVLGSIASFCKSEWRKQSVPFVLSGTAFLLSGYVLQRISDFSFLIAYERFAYADRLFVVADLLLLWPLLIVSSDLIARLEKKTFLLLGIIIASAGWQSLHIYNSLPRHDAGAASYGWSVGRDEKEAVRWIDQQAQGQPYTVLANQNISAAAVEAFGFKRYINDVFYYPIPTGGPLYQLFLAATKKDTTIEPIKDAARLTQSHVVFVAVNQYWWDADLVNERLTQLSDEHQSFNNGSVMVFRFNVK